MIINPAGLFLILTPFGSLTSHNSCLEGKFFGNYKDGNVFRSIRIVDEPCFNSIAWAHEDAAFMAPIDSSVEQLIWVEEEEVDASLKEKSSDDEFELFLERLAVSPSSYGQDQDQIVLDGNSGKPSILYKADKAALLSISRQSVSGLDSILPRFWKYTPLPSSPVDYIPVPSPAVERVQHILQKLKFNPIVARLVNGISVPQMRNDIRFLTGEDGQSGIVSRHSFAQGSRTAARWLKERFEETGATCTLKGFLEGFAPNVICRYAAETNTSETLLISAHYDSRGSFGSTRAPGGDDDGSGTIALLGIARAIANSGVKFRTNVELVAFAGEEQGLLGSRAYARELREANANLTLMIQADMLGYHHPDEPAQLGLPKLIGTPEVAQLVADVSALYSPELTVGFTPACCSDHQSFHEQGFPATQVFERAGPIIDPMYHNSRDLSDRAGYDLAQVKSIAKVQFATLLHGAGFYIEE
ncbi:hypothetical protein V5O48_001302 [Marasmius crinis-equi]|uniref:Peptide hydrolase n=1 Tax=Marasmius crinis-equi TaxID=585013 RepID=A0ABR3G034_9AGAR